MSMKKMTLWLGTAALASAAAVANAQSGPDSSSRLDPALPGASAGAPATSGYAGQTPPSAGGQVIGDTNSANDVGAAGAADQQQYQAAQPYQAQPYQADSQQRYYSRAQTGTQQVETTAAVPYGNDSYGSSVYGSGNAGSGWSMSGISHAAADKP
jgi:hypothetical protein